MQNIKCLFEFYRYPQRIFKLQKFNNFKYYDVLVLSLFYSIIHTFLFLVINLTIFNPAFLAVLTFIVFSSKNLIRAGIIKLFAKTDIKYTNILKTITVSYVLIGIIIDIFNCIGQYYGLNIIEYGSVFMAVSVRIIYVFFMTTYYLKDVLKTHRWFQILYILDAGISAIFTAVNL